MNDSDAEVLELLKMNIGFFDGGLIKDCRTKSLVMNQFIFRSSF